MAVNSDALAILAGQLAGAIAPDTIGARLGQVGTQMGQSKILASDAEQKRQQMLDLINGLTGEGATTTSVKVTPEGKLSFTGESSPNIDNLQPTTQAATQPQPQAQTQPVAPQISQGGGNQTANPFLQLLGLVGA